MFEGTLVGIYVAPSAKARMESVVRVNGVAGRGLEGDRYHSESGTFSTAREPDAQVTLIEEEAVAAVARDTKAPFSAADTRRNLVTRDVPLNHLAGREFTIGSVRFRGHGLCEPCKHLESLAGAGLLRALLHRGGLRAEILTSGVLETGQPVRPG